MLSTKKKLTPIKIEPERVLVKLNSLDGVMVYKNIKRGAKGCWVITYQRRTYVYYDRDYDFSWFRSLHAAEEYLRSIYVSPGSTFGKPNYKLVWVKRPYSKDANDLVQRVQLTRFGGGYKYFDLDTTIVGSDAILKAYYQAEDWHWDHGIKLGLIKTKPGKDANQIRLLGLNNV